MRNTCYPLHWSWLPETSLCKKYSAYKNPPSRKSHTWSWMPVRGQLKGLMIATTTPIRRRSVALWPQQWLFLAEGCARHARSPSPTLIMNHFSLESGAKPSEHRSVHTHLCAKRAAQIQAGGEARPCEGRARSVNRGPRVEI